MYLAEVIIKCSQEVSMDFSRLPDTLVNLHPKGAASHGGALWQLSCAELVPRSSHSSTPACVPLYYYNHRFFKLLDFEPHKEYVLYEDNYTKLQDAWY